MNALVAVDKNWSIGYKNNLLERIPDDLKNFKSRTMKKVVIMGRKTLESLPEGKPLPNRRNMVITHQPEYKVEGAIVVHSIEEALRTLENFDCELEDVYVIGGGEIYEQMLPYCTNVYVTKIDAVHKSDTFFPNLDKLEEWKHETESEKETCNDIQYSFNRYKRRKEYDDPLELLDMEYMGDVTYTKLSDKYEKSIYDICKSIKSKFDKLSILNQIEFNYFNLVSPVKYIAGKEGYNQDEIFRTYCRKKTYSENELSGDTLLILRKFWFLNDIYGWEIDQKWCTFDRVVKKKYKFTDLYFLINRTTYSRYGFFVNLSYEMDNTNPENILTILKETEDKIDELIGKS